MKLIILIFLLLQCNFTYGQNVQSDSISSIIKNNNIYKNESVKISGIVNSHDNPNTVLMKKKKRIKRIVGISLISVGIILNDIAWTSTKLPVDNTSFLLLGLTSITGGIITLSIPIRDK